MTANPTLVKLRGIDEESVKQINLLHEKLDNLMSRANIGVFSQSVYDEIERIEVALQVLWKFGVDKSKHKWKNLYKFRCRWVGRKFECQDTGEVITITGDIRERDCIHCGKGAIDLGRLDGYYRIIGNIKEHKGKDG